MGQLLHQQFEELRCLVGTYSGERPPLLGCYFAALSRAASAGGHPGSSLEFLGRGRASQVVWCSGRGTRLGAKVEDASFCQDLCDLGQATEPLWPS